nr:lachesin-like [Leptinotarsa decemlineata]
MCSASLPKTPSISYISPNIDKDVKKTVLLLCEVENLGDHVVLWNKVDKNQDSQDLLISNGSSLISSDPRFSLRHEPDRSLYGVKIEDIRESDAGYYQCQILLPNSTVQAEVELRVRVPPTILRNTTRSISTSEGQDVQLHCYAEGYPSPNIFWRRENNVILPTGGSTYQGNILEIKQIRKEDRGTYFCVAENGLGKTIRKIDLQVLCAPVITVANPRVGQALNFDKDLECNVEAYPPPVITWKKDNTTLHTDQHRKISHFSLSDEFTNTMLRVISIEKEHYGQYVCRAANKLGIAEATIELFETDHPTCPPECVTTTTGSNLIQTNTSAAS